MEGKILILNNDWQAVIKVHDIEYLYGWYMEMMQLIFNQIHLYISFCQAFSNMPALANNYLGCW